MILLQKKSLWKKLTEKFGGSLRFVIIGSKADIWWENNCWLPCQCGHLGRTGSQREINPFSSFRWLFESLMKSSKLSEIWGRCLFRQVLPRVSVSPFQLEKAIDFKRRYNWFHFCSPLNANSPIGVETALSSIRKVKSGFRKIYVLSIGLADLGIRPLRWTKSRVTTTEYQTTAISSWYQPALLNRMVNPKYSSSEFLVSFRR